MKMVKACSKVTRKPHDGTKRPPTKDMQLHSFACDSSMKMVEVQMRSFSWESPIKMVKAWGKVTRRPCDGTKRPRTKDMQLRSF